ncbi:MAG: UDP-N-acetylmuramate dehydrogenase [Planctomycetota bacterium]|nr:MAG: UDP-N-acetylmuramate dehydrogenase [Planctomycetota bacterium]
MPSPAASLAEHAPCRELERLARWTTLRIGGPAELFFEPRRPEELAAVLDALEQRNLPWRILGGGANTLAPDGGVRGAVLHTGMLRRAFREGNRLRLWPGVTLPALVRGAAAHGLGGVERLVGVPGHVGGGIAMNAGSAEWGLWDQVLEVSLWDPRAAGARIVRRTRAEVQPRYRDGNLRGAVVLEALLELQPESPRTLRARMEEHLRRKNATQPVTLSSAGCAFKNPPGDSAGRLIDAAGLKGARAGGAAVSELHGNFIVNAGGASAADVRALLERMEGTVQEKFGVRLERELVVWPEPLGGTIGAC